jgi:uncharacterized membrane protein YGL010W
MQTKSIHQWLDEYSESHQNKTNKVIHWICVPAIFFSIICFLSLVPIPANNNLASYALIFVAIFYARLSPKLAFGIICLYLILYWFSLQLSKLSFPLWQLATAIFVVAWIIQFYRHKIEGKKPSFLKDIQYLLIGPAWLLAYLYKKIGIAY